MNVLSDEWSCYWVLASGSLVRYWELQPLSGLSMPRPEIAELVRPDLQRELSRYESSRVTFRWREKPIGRKELAEWVQEAPGPRLLILNTVQSAAVIAADMAAEFGQTHVEHLSTALTPEDSGNTIDRIRRRLRHGNGRDRLFQHIRGLVRVSDDWLEFVGHNHREYGIGSTVCANGMKI